MHEHLLPCNANATEGYRMKHKHETECKRYEMAVRQNKSDTTGAFLECKCTKTEITSNPEMAKRRRTQMEQEFHLCIH